MQQPQASCFTDLGISTRIHVQPSARCLPWTQNYTVAGLMMQPGGKNVHHATLSTLHKLCRFDMLISRLCHFEPILVQTRGAKAAL